MAFLVNNNHTTTKSDAAAVNAAYAWVDTVVGYWLEQRISASRTVKEAA